MSRLGGWKGQRVGIVERFKAGDERPRAEVWIELIGFVIHPRKYSDCGQFVRNTHNGSKQEVPDLPLFDADTDLVAWRARAACPRCGPKMASHKGQSYTTAITDPETRHVLWVWKGHGLENVRLCFDRIEKKGFKRIQATGLDMSSAFEGDAQRRCPTT